MAGRRCPGKDEQDGRTRACPTILTNGERYCPRHARAYEQRRGPRQARGYDTRHDRMRAALVTRMNAGETIHCIDCGVKLTPATLDLGHTEDRTAYRGPQCATCNRSDGGRRGRLTQT